MAERNPNSHTAQDLTSSAFAPPSASADGTAVPLATAVIAPPRIGQYAIVGELGRGGMGIVYRAEDPDLKRDVALKIMLPQFAANKTAKGRFVREARAQAKVEHEHVAVIHQVAEHEGVPYLVMPLLKGMTLHTALRANPRPPLNEVIRIGREMAEGLAAAHESGLVHRDIKPANIWLEGKKLRVRILDFGLARIAADAEATHNDNGPVTREGALIGTPSYMSPEQARGLRVDGRTDVWSVGVILYQMTTGELPFNGTSPIGILTAVALDIPPSPMERNPAIPLELSNLIVRCLAKDPAHRPATAEALAEELRALETGLAGMARLVSLDATPSLTQHAAGPDPFAEIDATEPSGVAKPVERRQSPSTPQPKLWLYVGGGAAVLALIVVVALAASKGDKKPVEVVQDDPPPKPPLVKPKDKDKKDPLPALTPLDYRAIQGATFAELQAWVKELTPRFRPVALSVRGASSTPTFDAIAIPDNHEWEFTTTGEGGEQNLFDIQKRRGFVPRVRVLHPVDGRLGISEVWVKETVAWGSLHLPRVLIDGRLKEPALADFVPQQGSAMSVNGRLYSAVFMLRQAGQPWTLDWDMTLDDLNRKVADARKSGAGRLKSITAVFDANRVRFTAVFLENRGSPSWWDFQSGLSREEYEKALTDRKAKRQRPSSVASYVLDGKVSYAVLWEEVADPDTERRAAQLLKPLATTITVRTGWSLHTISRAEPLPEANFEVAGLVFSDPKMPLDFVAKTLVPTVSELRALSHLRLSGPVPVADIARLAATPLAETLTDLQMYECELSAAALEQLKKFRNLGAVGLSARTADDDMLARLKEIPKLSSLALRGLDARGKAGDRGVEAITTLPLRSLALLGCDLSPQHYRDIADMPNLVSLDLDSSTTDDGCVADLVTASKLQALDLSSTKITEKALASIEKIASLRLLELRRLRLPDRAVRHLATQRPDLRIIHDTGVFEAKKP